MQKKPSEFKPDPELVVYRKHLAAKEAEFVPFPSFIDARIRLRLAERGIFSVYRHQAEALTAVYNHDDVVVATGTSSGKSLCYQVPILEQALLSPIDCALLIFPTKALTQDQLTTFRRLLPEFRSQIAVFDGDTDPRYRSVIKENVRILLTNPDMVHFGLLPFHPGWARFFQNLKIVVVDEAHVYRGVFGSHAANVFRRMNRICSFYTKTAQPHRYILASATLSNAGELAEKLTERRCKVILNDQSGGGERDIYFVNPPIINQEFHLRAGSVFTGARLARELTQAGRQTLVFLSSRQSVESAVRRLRDFGVPAQGYRSGYLKSERREIEAGLKSGETRCVAATNALELGMDIGGMDAVLSIGYPGSIAAFYQRLGRAGRNRRDSIFFFVPSQNPTDQYIVSHPEFIFSRSVEPALIDPDNLLLLYQHLQCALFELPFAADERFGGLSLDATQEILDYFRTAGIAHFSGGRYYWIAPDTPQRTVSLRNSGLDRIHIRSENRMGKLEKIGEIDRSSAYWMIHPGAIYFHNGKAYRIEELNLDENSALAVPTVPTYLTQADQQRRISVNETERERETVNGKTLIGSVTVTTQVVGYKKTDIETGESLGVFPLELPANSIDTKAFILILSSAFRDRLRDKGIWTNDANDYGENWPQLRKAVLARDLNTCQLCGRVGKDDFLHVHHKIPFRSFASRETANALENLAAFCPECHRRVEEAVRIKSGLSGFANAFHQLAALFLECDVNDLNCWCDPEHSAFDGLPALFLYETVPGGLGLSQTVQDRFGELAIAVCDLIQGCGCVEGCPGCVGAPGEEGFGGVAAALAIGRGFSELDPARPERV